MTGYLIGEEDRRRLSALLDAFEAGRLTASKAVRSAPAPARVETYLGYADGDIPAKSGDTPGEGSAVLYEFAWDDDAEEYTLSYDGDNAVTVYNVTTTAVTDGATVHMLREPIGGQLVVLESGATASATCCTLSGLTADDCLRLTRLSASGACDCADPAVNLLLAYDLAEDAFTTADRVTVCGVEYQPLFDFGADGQERFGLRTTTGGSGGETTYYASRSCCCGDDCLTFALGGLLCTGTRDCPATPPSQNVLRFSVAWEACPNPLYYGPGWYLVDGNCVQYTSDPGTCVEITSGPFESEADCGDATPDPMPCLGLTFSAGSGDGTLVISNGTGDCTCADGTVPGNTGGVDTKVWATTTCPGNQTITLSCSGGNYALAVSGGATATLVSANPDPFVLVYDVTGATCGGAGPTGTYRVTITHPGP